MAAIYEYPTKVEEIKEAFELYTDNIKHELTRINNILEKVSFDDFENQEVMHIYYNGAQSMKDMDEVSDTLFSFRNQLEEYTRKNDQL